MANVTVKSGNVSASCEDGGVVFRTSDGKMVKFPYDDFEVLASAVREKKHQIEMKNRKNNPMKAEVY